MYVGQTARALETRIKKHRKAVEKDDKNSLIAKHSRVTDHSFDFNNVEILSPCAHWSERMFLEAWYSICNENSINEHMQIPNVYNVLANR